MGILGSVFLLTLYFGGYGLVHSWLADASIKGWALRTFGPSSDHWYRMAYNIFAVISLLPMLILMAVLPGEVLYVVPAPWHWFVVAGQLLAVAAIAITLLQTGALHFAGLAQLVDDAPVPTGPLTVSGFYAFVRHPLYTFSLIFLWLMPFMTTNTLTAFILFTLYFYFGSIFEERRLVAEFGSIYEEYRRQVPRLVPMPGRRYVPPLKN